MTEMQLTIDYSLRVMSSTSWNIVLTAIDSTRSLTALILSIISSNRHLDKRERLIQWCKIKSYLKVTISIENLLWKNNNLFKSTLLDGLELVTLAFNSLRRRYRPFQQLDYLNQKTMSVWMSIRWSKEKIEISSSMFLPKPIGLDIEWVKIVILLTTLTTIIPLWLEMRSWSRLREMIALVHKRVQSLRRRPRSNMSHLSRSSVEQKGKNRQQQLAQGWGLLLFLTKFKCLTRTTFQPLSTESQWKRE